MTARLSPESHFIALEWRRRWMFLKRCGDDANSANGTDAGCRLKSS